MTKKTAYPDPRNPRVKPHRPAQRGADWESVDAELIRHAIATCTWASGALRFGYTRDGGCYALGIYGLGEPYTEYIRPNDDIEGFLRDVIEAFSELPKIGGYTPPSAERQNTPQVP